MKSDTKAVDVWLPKLKREVVEYCIDDPYNGIAPVDNYEKEYIRGIAHALDYLAKRNLITQWQTPKGWKLVPEEPTDEMAEEGMNAILTPKLMGNQGSEMKEAIDAYKNMISAAPTPPEEETK